MGVPSRVLLTFALIGRPFYIQRRNRDMREIIETLKSLHRTRDKVMEEYVRNVNKGNAAIKYFLGWEYSMAGTPEGTRLVNQAREMYAAIEVDGSHPELADQEGRDLVVLVTSFQASARLFKKQVSSYAWRLESTARKLPVAAWVEHTNGFGLPTLGSIIGECGSLSKGGSDGYQGYKTVSRLVKRMQMAVIDGKVQGKPGEVVNKRRVASKEDWKKHGRCPRRRKVMYNLGESLVKAGDKCPYRSMYEEMKVMYAARGLPKWQVDRCAKRRIAKRALADLWEEWNGIKTTQRVAM